MGVCSLITARASHERGPLAATVKRSTALWRDPGSMACLARTPRALWSGSHPSSQHAPPKPRRVILWSSDIASVLPLTGINDVETGYLVFWLTRGVHLLLATLFTNSNQNCPHTQNCNPDHRHPAGAHESLLAIRGLGQREQLLDEQQRLGVGLEPGSLRAGLQLLARQRRQLGAHGLAAGRALTA